MQNNVIEIEVSTQFNRNVYFPPLDRVIRGRFEWIRCANPKARALGGVLNPEGVPDFPGMHLRVDIAKREGAIIDPIGSDPKLKNYIRKQFSQTVREDAELFPGINANEWLFRMKQLVDLGKATIVEGQFPATINYVPPDNPLAPAPKRGDARRQEIFLKHPEVAAQYLKMKDDEKARFEQLVGI